MHPHQVGALAGPDVAWARAGKGIGSGDLIFVAPNDKGPGFLLKQVPAVNGALVAMDPDSGRVLAMVGGYSFSLSSFNTLNRPNFQNYVGVITSSNFMKPTSADQPRRLQLGAAPVVGGLGRQAVGGVEAKDG